MKRRRHRDVSTMPVMAAKCRTCPFGPAGDPELRSRIERTVLTAASQTCHHTGVIHGKPDTHLCRGARDLQLQFFHRLGFLPAPTDQAWKEKQKELAK